MALQLQQGEILQCGTQSWQKEIASLLEEGEPIEVNCQFCNSHYKFSPDELKEMLLKAAAK